MSLRSPLSSPLLHRHPRVVAAGALLIAVGTVALLAVYGTDSPWVPKCLFHALTGLDCPGCGSQRAIVAATQGRWADAWSLNPALWIGLCVASIYAIFPHSRHPHRRLERTLYSPAAYLTIATAIAAWTLFRNI